MTQLPTEREKLLSDECERLRNKLNALEQEAKKRYEKAIKHKMYIGDYKKGAKWIEMPECLYFDRLMIASGLTEKQ